MTSFGRNVRRLLIAVAALTASAALAAPPFRITPEQPIADPAVGGSEGILTDSAVVSDGDGFVVFWIGPGGVHASPFTADGSVRIATPHIAIPVASTIRNISACWSGSSYLVTWRDDNGPSLYAAAVSRDGNLIGSPQLVASNANTESGTLASNGRRALVAYITGPPITIRGALLAPDASVIAADIPLGIENLPVVASDGNDFALTWRTGPPIIAMSPPAPPPAPSDFELLRISERGTPIGSTIDLGRTYTNGAFGVAFGDGLYAIVGLQQQYAIERRTFDPQGGTVNLLPTVPAGGYEASVYWNGSRFIAYVLDSSNPTSYTIRTVSFSGQPEDTPPATVASFAEQHRGTALRFASNGRSALGVWSDSSNPFGTPMQIVGQLFDAPATKPVAERRLVSLGWSRQYSPAIASSGSESLAVWVDERGSETTSGVLAARIGPNGVVIDRTPIVLASGTPASNPRVTFTGKTYLAAWEEPDAALVVRTIGRDGALGSRVALGKGWGGVSMASNATTTLVVWSGVNAVRFDADGQRIDATPIKIGDGYGPQAASNGTDFLVAWNVGSDYWQFPSPNAVDVLGARVTAAGSVDAAPIEIATGGADQVLGSIASDGRDYLVVYTYMSNDTVLAAKRVLREGQLDGSTPADVGAVVAAGGIGTSLIWPTVAADDNGFWIAFFSLDPPVATAKLEHTDPRGNPGEVVTLMTGPFPASPMSLAHAPGRMLEIAYGRRISDGLYTGTMRAFVRYAGDIGPRTRAARH